MVVLSRMLSDRFSFPEKAGALFLFPSFLTEHELACVFRAETTFGKCFHLEWVFLRFFSLFLVGLWSCVTFTVFGIGMHFLSLLNRLCLLYVTAWLVTHSNLWKICSLENSFIEIHALSTLSCVKNKPDVYTFFMFSLQNQHSTVLSTWDNPLHLTTLKCSLNCTIIWV